MWTNLRSLGQWRGATVQVAERICKKGPLKRRGKRQFKKLAHGSRNTCPQTRTWNLKCAQCPIDRFVLAMLAAYRLLSCVGKFQTEISPKSRTRRPYYLSPLSWLPHIHKTDLAGIPVALLRRAHRFSAAPEFAKTGVEVS